MLVVNAKTAVMDATGLHFHVYAKRYRNAAILCLTAKNNIGFDVVPIQLQCQALELHLKSFIWHTDGIGLFKIKNKYGHNIKKLWRHSKARGLHRFAKVTNLRESVIELIGDYYKERRFCYLDIDMVYSGYDELKSNPKIIQTLNGLNSQLEKTLWRVLPKQEMIG